MHEYEFYLHYQSQFARLEEERLELESILRDELKKFEEELLGVRLVESRVKSCDSLYTKVRRDLASARKGGKKRPGHRECMDPGAIPDLIGARIVCYSTRDKTRLYEELDQGRFSEQLIRMGAGTSKRFSVNPTDVGYRGDHVIVRWHVGGARDRIAWAEIQVRTMLDDAFATYGHQAYKAQASVKRKQAQEDLRLVSEQLILLERGMERIADRHFASAVANGSSISRSDALAKKMYALLPYFNPQIPLPRYVALKRHDTYDVIPNDARYSFRVDGTLADEESFRFLLVGDTDARNCDSLVTCRADAGGVLQPISPGVHRSGKAVYLTDATKSARHDYQISCTWKGVFEQPVDYVLCPWREIYGEVMKEYTLTLRFARPPMVPPIVFRLGAVPNLPTAYAVYSEFSRKSPTVAATALPDGCVLATEVNPGDLSYVFRLDPPSHSYLCLFGTTLAP